MTRHATLADVIAPVPVDRFLAEIFEREHLILRREDASTYQDLFTIDDFDRVLFAAAATENSRITVVPPTGSGQRGRFLHGAEIQPKALYEAFGSGATLVANQAHRLSPTLGLLAGALAADLSAEVTVNLYLTPPQSQGFELHFDAHDVFVMQVHGAKTWSLYAPPYSLPTEKQGTRNYLRRQVRLGEVDDDQLLEEVTLHTGDLLYLPRGFPHKAVATGETSLHLTIGVYPDYWTDLVKAAVEGAAEDYVALRRALPPGYVSDPAVRETMAETFEALVVETARRAASAFEPALEALAAGRLRGQRLPADGHFGQLAALDAVGPETEVVRRPGSSVSVEVDDKIASIRFGEHRVQGPAALARAMTYVAAHRRFRVADLPGLSDKSATVLARRLIREGLLRTA